jgi:[protein-PII] uridylyltransferase
MPGRVQQHARERLNFTGEVPVAKRLSACRTFLRLEGRMIRMRHDGGDPGLKVAQSRAAMVDEMLAHLFDYAVNAWVRKHGNLPSPVALLALGGYGRGELSLLSDIDIMFLFSSRTKPAAIKPLQEHLTNEILYILWDSGLKVGHSTRTVDDVFTYAREDIQTKTALLEARLVAGSSSLFDTFSQAYRSLYLSENPKGYLAARLADQASRRAKYGDTVYLQEPDIKNGVGGLRDYQNAFWMARVKLGISNIAELQAQNYLLKNELRDFQRAYNFLLRVRNELHFMSKHPTDMLSLDVQPRIAQSLGYTARDPLRRVEQFMQDYYHAARTIFRVSKVIESRLALTLAEERSGLLSFKEVLKAQRFQKTKHVDGFVLRGRELAAEHPKVFSEDPSRLIRVFRHCQQLSCTPDFALKSLIRESLPLLTRKVRSDSDANLSFRTILTTAGSVFPILELMHELGVLGRFIPEFDRLNCLVQHEYYHRYTADVHTLAAIRQLDGVFSVAEPIAEKYRQALRDAADPDLLYITLLLHDLGKAQGIKKHADRGVEIAVPLLERFQVPEESRELVTKVIKNHLIMARFWQTRDVDDPQTAAAFAEIVQDAEVLRHLYVHTFCDARGTSAGLWNSYKDTLHTTLYRTTLARLKHGAAIDLGYREKKQMTQKELIKKTIPGVSAEEISAHFNLLPDRYFIQTDANEISLHIGMVHRLLKSISEADSVGSLRPIIEWKDDINRSLTVVNVVTWDRAGLFYKLAGALSVSGLSILGARIISRSDHIAIDTFYVVEPGGGVVQNTAVQESFAKNIELALVANKDLYPEIVAQAEKSAKRLLSTPSGESLQSSFPPTVDVYHELSMERTIVEIQAHDQIGLLYRLGKAISDHGFDITFARIGTERGVAIDTFYIESADKEPVTDEKRLPALREALSGVITPAKPAESATG